MFSFKGQKESPSKCYVTHANLPKYIDSEQPPIKRKPFSTILNQAFNHTVLRDMFDTRKDNEEIYNTIWYTIESQIKHVRYSRVFLPLSALLEADFFNNYIKTGNVLMLSEGRPGIDNLYSLKDGLLRLELPKEVYERAGLVGKPIRDGGRKHMKTRYAIEINLRLPSMLHGKKGFERILWASKNVLNHSVTWLFYDFGGKNDSTSLTASQPIEKHHPITKVCEPRTVHLPSVLVPSMQKMHQSLLLPSIDIEETATDLLEWFDLILLESPRVRSNDSIDPYLCRYSVPESEGPRDMVKVTWQGFVPALWVRSLFLELLKAMKTLKHNDNWFALSVKAFETEAVDGIDGYTLLRLPSRSGVSDEDKAKVDYVLWEMATTP
ncbi:hypothetical protein MMC14_008112 [Varicellaria rhodocarpa]|nr:hypothetical protein [Varicellaria rhodocarpa]